MATGFVNRLGLEWTDVVINEESGAIVWTNFDGNSVPDAGTDIEIGVFGVTISNSYFDHHSPMTGPVAARDLHILSGGSVTAIASQMTIHNDLFNEGTFTIQGDRVTVLGDIVNDYLMTINGMSNAAYLLLDSGVVTISGSGDLRLTSNLDGTAYLSGRNGELTLLANEGRISGTGYIGWSGQIYYPGGYVAIDNSGTIDANLSGRSLIIAQGTSATNPLENSGLLTATSGGRLIIDHALVEQTGQGRIVADGAGSRVVLSVVTVQGGLIDTEDGGVVLLQNSGGYGGGQPGFNGVVLDGSSGLGAVTIGDEATVRIGFEGAGDNATFKGAIVNHGDIGVLGYWSAFIVDTAGATLSGGGAVHLSYVVDSGNLGGAFILGKNTTDISTLTNVDNLIHGAGHIGIYGYPGYDNKLAFINGADGVVEADNPLAALTISQTVSFDNNGVLRASNGADLVLGTNTGQASEITKFDNGGGTIRADGAGSTVELRASEVRGGVLETSSGGMIRLMNGTYSLLDGSTAEGGITNKGIIEVTSGAIKGSITNNGTIGFVGVDAGLYVHSDGAGLSGTGKLEMGARSFVVGADSLATSTLTNNSIIRGGGFIGTGPYGPTGGALSLVNGVNGVIEASAGKTMLIDTAGSIVNAGTLLAKGGLLDIRDAVTGNGSVRASHGGSLKVNGDWTATVTFSGSTTESIRSNTSAWDAGLRFTLTGFGVGDRLELGYASGYDATAANSFAWAQVGSDGVFDLGSSYSGTIFGFTGLTQTHLELIEDGSGGMALIRRQTIEGTSGANVLSGTSGKDRFVGYAGDDRFMGSAGDDIYDGGAGSDTVDFSSATGGVTASLSSAALQTIGGGQGNDIFRFIENLTGSAHDDRLTGNSEVNTLVGGAGKDQLDGKAGADTMSGGIGDDTYVVDNTGDKVIEKSGEGSDLVKSSVSFTLGSYVENLTLTGSGTINATGNSDANVLTGNSGANILDGKAGADTMSGGKGDDTYVVDNTGDKVIEKSGEGTDLVKSSVSFTLGSYVENLTLTGSGTINATGYSGANVLTGNSAANILDGKAGADTMSGGKGDDTYVVDNTGDKVIEKSGEGTDLVKSSVSFTLGSYVENLTLTGSGKINATGNSGTNVLTGNSSANILDGKAGADTMSGGKGDDTYVVDNTGDKVVEKSGEGTDLVKSSVSFTLGSYVENLTLTGSGTINATGNSGTNVLTGNGGDNIVDGKGGADRLIGGLGADDLYGGTGADTFAFLALTDSTVASTGRDTIFDFSRKDGDRIDVSAIDASSKAVGNQAFKFVGTASFKKVAGELRYELKNGDAHIHADVDGDGKSDFSIHVDAVTSLKSTDFVL